MAEVASTADEAVARISRFPPFQLLQGREDEALKSLAFVFPGDGAEAEFRALKDGQEEAAAGGSDSPEDQGIWDPSGRASLLAGVGLIVLQQVTGQPSVLSYATPIFKDFGLADSASVLLAAFKLAATLCAVATVDRFGRKSLLYVGCTLMLMALTVLAAIPQDVAQAPGGRWGVLVAMVVYIGGYQVGFGPIGWVIIGEVFPLCECVFLGRGCLVGFPVSFGSGSACILALGSHARPSRSLPPIQPSGGKPWRWRSRRTSSSTPRSSLRSR